MRNAGFVELTRKRVNDDPTTAFVLAKKPGWSSAGAGKGTGSEFPIRKNMKKPKNTKAKGLLMRWLVASFHFLANINTKEIVSDDISMIEKLQALNC